MAVRIVQLSDLHLFAGTDQRLLGVNTHDSFQAVCDKVRIDEGAAKFILLSGDLSQDNSEGSYLRLANMLKELGKPAYYVPGNHDDPQLMASVFPRDTISNDKQLVVENWQIILLNSQKPGAVEGLLSATQLGYLEECLQAYPTHHAMIVFHHHPFHIGSAWLDNLFLTNADEFWQLTKRYSMIRTVLFGHIHQEQARVMHNINCFSAPSTCFQFARHQHHFGLEKLPPGYRWLELHEDGRFETGVVRLPHYVGIFDENAKGY